MKSAECHRLYTTDASAGKLYEFPSNKNRHYYIILLVRTEIITFLNDAIEEEFIPDGLYYEKICWVLVITGHVHEYLLEKSRVVQQGPGEGNFHIFYWMLNGTTPEEKSQLFLEHNNFKYVIL